MKRASIREEDEIRDICLILKALRLAAGLSQAQVAKRAGMSDKLVSKVECGWTNNLKVITVLRIVRAIGRDPRVPFSELR